MADVRLGVAIDATGARRGARGVESSVSKILRSVGGVGKVFGGATASISKFGSSLLSIQGLAGGIAVGALFSGLSSTIRDFNKSIADLSAITGATGADLDFLREKAKEFGATTTLSASQAADAFKLIASAKPDLLANVDALAAVTEETIFLAEAAGVALPAAATTLGQALNQFGAGAEQAGRFINVLAAGAKFGSSEIPATAAALVNAGTAAKAAGLSFEQTNTAIQLLAKTGITAESAGTKLSSIFTRLQVQANREFNPAIVGIEKALKNLRDANLSTADSAKLFGQFSINTARALISQADAFGPLNEQLTGTSTAYEQAAIKANSLDGDIKSLSSAAEGLRIALGSELEPSLREITQGFTELLRNAIELTPKLGDLVDQAVDLAAALAIGAVVFKAVTALQALQAVSAALGLKALPVLAALLSGGFTAGLASATAAATALWAALSPLLLPAGLALLATLAVKAALDFNRLSEALDANRSALDKVNTETRDLETAIGKLDRASVKDVKNTLDRAEALLIEADARRESAAAVVKQGDSFGGFLQNLKAAALQGPADLFTDPGAFFRGETLETPIKRAVVQLNEAGKSTTDLRNKIRGLRSDLSVFEGEEGFIGPILVDQDKGPDPADEVDKASKSQLKALKEAQRQTMNARNQIDGLVASLKQESATFGQSRSAVIEYDVTQGKLSETLKSSGLNVDEYREKIVGLSRAIESAAIEQQFGDPGAVLQQRIADLDKLSLSEMARSNALSEARDAAFSATEAMSRLSSEEQANLSLTRAQIELRRAEADARSSLGLDITAQQYATNNDLIREQIGVLQQEIALLERFPTSLEATTKITELRAEIVRLGTDIRTTTDDFRDSFRDNLSVALGDVIKGTASIEDAFGSMFDRIANTLLDQFASDISSSITGIFTQSIGNARGGGTSGSILGDLAGGLLGGVFGRRQFGGPAVANRPYLVGEGGEPEVFVPGTSGQIIPSANVGGVTVNMTITTPDANSFRASEQQIARDMSARIRRAQRFQG